MDNFNFKLQDLTDVISYNKTLIEAENKLIEKYNSPIMSLHLRKNKCFSSLSFRKCNIKKILNHIENNLFPMDILFNEVQSIYIGDSIYRLFSVSNYSSSNLKKEIIALENIHETMSLVNIEVINSKGITISRKFSDVPHKQCLICGKPIYICSRINRNDININLDKI